MFTGKVFVGRFVVNGSASKVVDDLSYNEYTNLLN